MVIDIINIIKSNMKGLHKLTYILLVIGGLNWGLEVFGVGVGSFLPGSVATIIYALVGLSAIVELFAYKERTGQSGSRGGSMEGGM